jgi:hypothetical protein
MCFRKEELILHIFVSFPFMLHIWNLLAIEYKFSIVWGGITLLHCFDTWKKKEKTMYILPAVMCLTIWLLRNKYIFESTIPFVQGALAHICGLMVGTSAHTICTPKRIRKPPDIIFSNIGWFDGVAQNNGSMSGVGGLIKIGENISYR